MAAITSSAFLVASSDPTSGSVQLSTDGDSFFYDLKTKIEIPKDAKNIRMAVLQAEVPWVVRNISTARANNKFYVESKALGAKTITIDDGLYSLQSYNSALSRGLVNAGLDSKAVQITGDSASQKIVVTLQIGIKVTFSALVAYEILGMTLNRIIPAADFSLLDGYNETGNTVALFDGITSFLISSDLVRQGFVISGVQNVIAKVQINKTPGKVLTYEPYKPLWINVDHLSGVMLQRAYFSIRDQRGLNVDFGGDFWNVLIEIKYERIIPLHTATEIIPK